MSCLSDHQSKTQTYCIIKFNLVSFLALRTTISNTKDVLVTHKLCPQQYINLIGSSKADNGGRDGGCGTLLPHVGGTHSPY